MLKMRYLYRCRWYFSGDPKNHKNVSKIETISYDEMVELASLGAKSIAQSMCRNRKKI